MCKLNGKPTKLPSNFRNTVSFTFGIHIDSMFDCKLYDVFLFTQTDQGNVKTKLLNIRKSV